MSARQSRAKRRQCSPLELRRRQTSPEGWISSFRGCPDLAGQGEKSSKPRSNQDGDSRRIRKEPRTGLGTRAERLALGGAFGPVFRYSASMELILGILAAVVVL